MIDGIIKADGTSRLMRAELPATYEEFRAQCRAGTQPLDVLFNALGWTQLPTFLNKRTLLTDATAALFGLGVDAVPDDVLGYLGKYSQHWWQRKALVSVTKYYENNVMCSTYYGGTTRIEFIRATGALYVSDAVTFDENTGKHTMVNPEVFTAGSSPSYSLEGKYVYSPDGRIQQYETDTYVTEILHLTSMSLLEAASGYSAYDITYSYVLGSAFYQVDVGEITFVRSAERNAYPDSGNDGEFEYSYLGIPYDNAVTAPAIATGSYTGTGTYDSSNPNSLTFDFVPKLVYVYSENNVQVGGDDITPNYFIWATGMTTARMDYVNGRSYYATFSASGNTLEWYTTSSSGAVDTSEAQLNKAGSKYYWVAIG